jgi:hypothetical protein
VPYRSATETASSKKAGEGDKSKDEEGSEDEEESEEESEEEDSEDVSKETDDVYRNVKRKWPCPSVIHTHFLSLSRISRLSWTMKMSNQIPLQSKNLCLG